MMHDPTRHPDDERLSALAEGDPEAGADRALTAHVAGCDRCHPIVDELAALRSALAALPDIVPPRPLRLLPPATEPRPAAGISVLRRLFAPALAAGVLLSIVGGVGSVGTLLSAGGATGAAAPAEVAEPATDQRATPEAGQPALHSFEPSSGDRNLAGGDAAKDSGASAPLPPNVVLWPLVLGAGLVLVAAALVLRYAIQPRAG